MQNPDQSTPAKAIPLPPVFLIGLPLLAIGAFFTLGGIIYTGPNIPAGLYFRVDKPLGIGKLVTFCPPDKPAFQQARASGLIGSGSCPDNYECLMFKVAGKRKDVVTINAGGVSINGKMLPDSMPAAKEGLGAINVDQYELKENEVLLMSNSTDNPFDARYFGVVDVEQVDSVISPLF